MKTGYFVENASLAYANYVHFAIKKLPGRCLLSIKAAAVFGSRFGGNMWELNPPGRFLAPLNGFEDRGTHQRPSTPISCLSYHKNRKKQGQV